MHLIKYTQMYNCYTFRHRDPIISEYLNKGIQNQHAYIGIVSPSLERPKYLNIKIPKINKVNNHKITVT
jgi:hypothetical protein